MVERTKIPEGHPEAEEFIRKLLDRASAQRLVGLFSSPPPDTVYHLRNRQGVSVVAVDTPGLTEEQLVQVMTYRLAQYVMADQLDPIFLCEQRLEHEPLSNVSPMDLHVFAGDASTGEILCYFTIESAVPSDDPSTFSATERQPFPVESVFGVGVYNRLQLLPETQARRVRELGRFAKNHLRDPLHPLSIRGPIELSLTILRLLSGVLMEEVDACIGDIELGVVKKNLDYFHVPTAIIHGVVPYAPMGSFGHYNYLHRDRYPFAFLCSDLSRARLDAIEVALEKPGNEGLLALLELKNIKDDRRSSLEPPGGLPELATVDVPQQDVPMAKRKERLVFGERLRRTDIFSNLSVAEAAVLGTFFERRTYSAGEIVIRQGESGEEMFLIESGTAEVRLQGGDGSGIVVAVLGPGEFFGEIALVAGSERTADVVVASDATLLRLGEDAYVRYLSHLVDVEGRLTRTALTRTSDTLHRTRELDAEHQPKGEAAGERVQRAAVSHSRAASRPKSRKR